MSGPVPSPVARPARALYRFRTVVRRWLRLLVLCTLLGGVGAFVASMFMQPTYRATALLLVGSPTTQSDPNSALLASDQLVTTYLGLITQPVVLERAADHVFGVSALQLAKQVHVKDQAGTQVIELDVDDSNPERAAQLANAIADSFISIQQDSTSAALTRAQQHVDEQLTQLSAQIATLTSQITAVGTWNPLNPQLQSLQQQLSGAVARRDALQQVSSQLTTQEITAADSVSIFQPATPPLEPDHPKPLLNAAIGGGLGLVIASALIWLLEFFDDHIRTPQEAEKLFGLPVLTVLSSYPKGALLKDNSSRKLATEVHTLVANIELACLADAPRTFAVTSAVSGEGRTTIAVNLATALARKGKRVLLVDADLHQSRRRDVAGLPGLASLGSGDSHLDINDLVDTSEGLPYPFGLSHILTRQVLKATPLATVPGVPGLYVLPAGPELPDPSNVFRSSRMRQFLQWLTDDPAGGRFDAIVLDTPPTNSYPDAALLAQWADATVLVVNTVRSGEEAVRRVFDILQRADVSITGIALNQASRQAHHGYNVIAAVQEPSLEPEAPHTRSLIGAEETSRNDSTTVLPTEPTARTSPSTWE